MYDRIIFVGNDNTCRSPVAEAIFRHLYKGSLPRTSIMSRGLIVLFEEPYNTKAVNILSEHGIDMGSSSSKQLEKDELGTNTLVLTMAFTDKLKIIEDYEFEQNVYTLKEYIGNDDELLDPYGEDMDIYEAFYQDMYDAITEVVAKFEEETDR